ncbi:MAG: RNA polymerase sigma factor [Acidobacteria bacterium]|nr:RNA polymerase sigma factor [Acidobacteriota bacterium]MDA1235203.1 RNA polymerase sigma factor [Acidobacteriota bacterium]
MVQEAQQLSDSELVAAVLRKDRKATAEFLSRFGGAVHAYLVHRLMPRQDLVEDLFQQVFLEAWQGLESFRGRSAVKTWLLGIARHKVQDHYRRRLREVQFDEDAPDPADGEDLMLSLEQDETARGVWQVLASVDEAPRTLLLWRYWEGWSAESMASETGKSVKAVERALARARTQFKQRWYINEQRLGGYRQ